MSVWLVRKRQHGGKEGRPNHKQDLHTVFFGYGNCLDRLRKWLGFPADQNQALSLQYELNHRTSSSSFLTTCCSGQCLLPPDLVKFQRYRTQEQEAAGISLKDSISRSHEKKNHRSWILEVQALVGWCLLFKILFVSFCFLFQKSLVSKAKKKIEKKELSKW